MVIVRWCNGNTADFGSAFQGSNPCRTTTPAQALATGGRFSFPDKRLMILCCQLFQRQMCGSTIRTIN